MNKPYTNIVSMSRVCWAYRLTLLMSILCIQHVSRRSINQTINTIYIAPISSADRAQRRLHIPLCALHSPTRTSWYVVSQKLVVGIMLVRHVTSRAKIIVMARAALPAETCDPILTTDVTGDAIVSDTWRKKWKK